MTAEPVTTSAPFEPTTSRAPSRWPRRVGHLLGEVARSPGAGPVDPRLLQHVDPPVALAASRHHRLPSAVHLALRSSPEPWGHLLASDHRAAVVQHVTVLAALSALAPTLDALGVPWCVLKGPVLVAEGYGRSDLRWYGDLDVLINPHDIPEVVPALEAEGYAVLDRNWPLIEGARLGELHVLTPQGVVMDLHMELINNADRRERFSVDARAALGRRRPVDLGPVTVPALEHVDGLVHLALHAALAGNDRLGWLLDVDRTWRHSAPDHGALVHRAHEWGAALALHVVLDRCRVALGTPVPREVLTALARNPWWRSAVRAVHVLDPVERSTGRRSSARALARSVSGSTPATLRELVAGRRATHLGLSGRGAFVDDPADPRSVLYDAGGEAARAAFFERLGAGRGEE